MESVSKDEEDEHTFALSPNVHNITSMENVPHAKDGGWVVHPNNSMIVYATNFMANGKYIIRLCGKNAYIGLFTLENLQDHGDIPEMGIIE